MAAKTLTPAELAVTFETDARTVRKFLRSVTDRDAQPGKGSRWAIEARKVASLRKRFDKWTAELEAKRAAAEETTEDAAPEE